MDIAEALKAKGYEIDRKKITLKDAIKITGEYHVPVKLHREVILNVPVTVTAEGAVKEAKVEAKEEVTETATETAEA